MKKHNGMPTILEMSELVAEVERISPIKPIVVEGVFFSDRKKMLGYITARHSHDYFIYSNKSAITYKARVYLYKNTTKEKILEQFKKRMEKWTKPPGLGEKND